MPLVVVQLAILLAEHAVARKLSLPVNKGGMFRFAARSARESRQSWRLRRHTSDRPLRIFRPQAPTIRTPRSTKSTSTRKGQSASISFRRRGGRRYTISATEHRLTRNKGNPQSVEFRDVSHWVRKGFALAVKMSEHGARLSDDGSSGWRAWAAPGARCARLWRRMVEWWRMSPIVSPGFARFDD